MAPTEMQVLQERREAWEPPELLVHLAQTARTVRTAPADSKRLIRSSQLTAALRLQAASADPLGKAVTAVRAGPAA